LPCEAINVVDQGNTVFMHEILKRTRRHDRNARCVGRGLEQRQDHLQRRHTASPHGILDVRPGFPRGSRFTEFKCLTFRSAALREPPILPPSGSQPVQVGSCITHHEIPAAQQSFVKAIPITPSIPDEHTVQAVINRR
jgi:hypothetical protein